MDQELKLTIILESPPPGIDFGLQKGSGAKYEVVQIQRSQKGDLRFEFEVRVGEGKEGEPNFLGPFVQGPTGGRFVYIGIGTFAGQKDTLWSRRLKVPLSGISWNDIKKAKSFETHVQGTAKDGSPTCATVKPFAGWKIKA